LPQPASDDGLDAVGHGGMPGRPEAAVQRQHQQPPQPLTVGGQTDLLVQLRRDLTVIAPTQEKLGPQLDGRPAHLLEATDL
jgi:hypothetical protein